MAILVEGARQARLVQAQGYKVRPPDEPTTERSVLGPKEGFVEDFQINVSLVRRRVRSPHLRVVRSRIGTEVPRSVAVVYMANVANVAIVSAVFARLHSVRSATISGASHLASYLAEPYLSPFPLVEMTERPSAVSRELINGRVAIIVENDPFVLLVPTTFWDLQQSVDDYTGSTWRSNFMRAIRLLATAIAVTGPGIYVALLMVNFSVIPSELALSVVASRVGVPFSVTLEYGLLIVVFEILREVSLRIPRSMGPTIGVVGGIVLGQAIVQSGIVSAPLIVVVALVGLSIYTAPHFQLVTPIRYLALGGLVAGGLLGLFGLLLAGIVVVAHLSSLTSFDVPYLAPVSPRSPAWTLVMMRSALADMRKRPRQYRPRSLGKAKKYATPVLHPPTEESS